jgi:hypothetical protein
MYFFAKTSIPAGQTVNSFAHYFGAGQSPNPVFGAWQRTLGVSGVVSGVTVKVQCALIDTDTAQTITPSASDWFDVNSYTTNTLTNLNCNEVWIRFVAINTTGSAVSVSALLGGS